MIGERVIHGQRGHGVVVGAHEDVLFVRFDSGELHSVLLREVKRLRTVDGAVAQSSWDPALEVLVRASALAIRSANDRWGVFTTSRVQLLPHQLWVAHRVLGAWPNRWLVADDVGLGKTIEAGLILAPLLSRQLVRRLLVICPASLVEQWQQRLLEMFDIRSSTYSSEADRPKVDFWNAHHQVVASIHTLRIDSKGRWQRLIDADPWDLIVVDEAHHLSLDANNTRTLALDLLRRLDAAEKIRGLLLFTGTPHRGKDTAFLGLLELLDKERFDSRKPLEDQLDALPSVMLRNNKQTVTDMAGNRLFQPTTVLDSTYRYTPAEAAFYQRMSDFIDNGLMYANRADLHSQRRNKLVLVTLQKLAASSVAAVRRALAGRIRLLETLDDPDIGAKARLQAKWEELQDLATDDAPETEDKRRSLEEQIDDLLGKAMLSPDEIPQLKELIALADDVGPETRIAKVLELVDAWPEGTTALLFTEYKATQALVVSALAARFGREVVSFINGDGFLDGVTVGKAVPARWTSDRANVADRFNRGELRFLVSTEAAGEGIDLQGNCHTLVHVDMPWNPMRMHQRVGRLNRFGQKHPVTVHILRNPDTVESRVWEILNERIERICLVHGTAMAHPEDIRELVLGLSSGGLMERLISRAQEEKPADLGSWFEAEAGTFGGEDALRVVEAIIGRSSRFDYGRDFADLPRVDLPALAPFLRAALRARGRQFDETEDGLFSFITPKAWADRPGALRSRYDRLHFDRNRKRKRKEVGDRSPEEQLLGAGHRLLETALDDAIERDVLVTTVDATDEWLIVHGLRDAVSGAQMAPRRVIYGTAGKGDQWRLLHDWELVELLGDWLKRPDRRGLRETAPAAPGGASAELARARDWLMAQIPTLGVGMVRPVPEVMAVIGPAT